MNQATSSLVKVSYHYIGDLNFNLIGMSCLLSKVSYFELPLWSLLKLGWFQFFFPARNKLLSMIVWMDYTFPAMSYNYFFFLLMTKVMNIYFWSTHTRVNSHIPLSHKLTQSMLVVCFCFGSRSVLLGVFVVAILFFFNWIFSMLVIW